MTGGLVTKRFVFFVFFLLSFPRFGARAVHRRNTAQGACANFQNTWDYQLLPSKKTVMIPFKFNGIMTTFRKAEVDIPLYANSAACVANLFANSTRLLHRL